MAVTKFIMGMRDRFFSSLFPIFTADENCVFITADNGAPTLDQFGHHCPGRFIQVGIAEQQLVGMAAGFGLEGYKVYAYAIAPFITTRCLESVKLDLCGMNLPVVLIGIGAGYAYDISGVTHHTVEDIALMRAMPNMKIYSPADGGTAAALASLTFRDPSPQYIRFDRSGIPDLYEGRQVDWSEGLVSVRPGKDLCIVACGVMVHEAIKAAEALCEQGVDAGVIDLFRLKPINADRLLQELNGVSRVVTVEEHLLAGGMGSAVLELLADAGMNLPVLRIGQNDRFVFDLGGRKVIWKRYGLDAASITRRVGQWLGL